MEDTFKRMEKEKKKEKIFADHISDKGFLHRLYKELSEFDNKKTNNPVCCFFLMGKRFERIFYQRRYPNGKLSLEKMFKLLVIRKKSN